MVVLVRARAWSLQYFRGVRPVGMSHVHVAWSPLVQSPGLNPPPFRRSASSEGSQQSRARKGAVQSGVTAFRWRSRRTDSPRPHPCGRGSVSAKPRFRRLSVAHEPAGFQPAVVQAGPSRAGSQASSDLVPQPVSTGFRATLAFTRIEPHSCPLCAILGELGATMSHFSVLAGSAFARPSFCEQNPQNRAARTTTCL